MVSMVRLPATMVSQPAAVRMAVTAAGREGDQPSSARFSATVRSSPAPLVAPLRGQLVELGMGAWQWPVLLGLWLYLGLTVGRHVQPG